MVTVLTDVVSRPRAATPVDSRRERAPHWLHWTPEPSRPRSPSAWRSPTFYLAIPLTLLLFATVFTIRAIARLRRAMRPS